MSLSIEGDVATLADTVTSDEAVGLMIWAECTADASVSLADLKHLHTSVLQVLMMNRPRCIVPPNDPELAAWLVPIFTNEN